MCDVRWCLAQPMLQAKGLRKRCGQTTTMMLQFTRPDGSAQRRNGARRSLCRNGLVESRWKSSVCDSNDYRRSARAMQQRKVYRPMMISPTVFLARSAKGQGCTVGRTKPDAGCGRLSAKIATVIASDLCTYGIPSIAAEDTAGVLIPGCG